MNEPKEITICEACSKVIGFEVRHKQPCDGTPADVCKAMFNGASDAANRAVVAEKERDAAVARLEAAETERDNLKLDLCLEKDDREGLRELLELVAETGEDFDDSLWTAIKHQRDAAHAKIAKVATAIEPYLLQLAAAGRTGILATDAVGLLVAEREELKRKLAEMEALFDVQYKADQRAIARWQEMHPDKKLIWPDRADMVVWLMAKLAEAEKVLAESRDFLSNKMRPFLVNNFGWIVDDDSLDEGDEELTEAGKLGEKIDSLIEDASFALAARLISKTPPTLADEQPARDEAKGGAQ